MIKTPDILEISSLGRPFRLGMLYDARSDKLIPGITLWDQNELRKNIDSTPKPFTHYNFIASDKLDEKASSLKVSASLSLSFMAGLVTVSGSADYLNNQRTSSRESTVALQFSCTTRFDQLTMEHLGKGNTKHAHVFDDNIATHVVVGITYGADAFLVFSREQSDSESEMEVKGSLAADVKKIPTLSKNGEGRISASIAGTARRQNISCKFYGDFRLDDTPSNYEEAVAVYQVLPKMIEQNGVDKSVAKQVWLCPLSAINSKAGQIVRDISERLVKDAAGIMQDLTDIKLEADGLLSSHLCHWFAWIKDDLKTMKKCVSSYQSDFVKKLAEILPKVRGNDADEQGLAELLANHHRSPCNIEVLRRWIEKRQSEMNILDLHTKALGEKKFIKFCFTKMELYTVLYSSHVSTILSLDINLRDQADPFIDVLRKFVANGSHGTWTLEQKFSAWYEDTDCLERMRNDVHGFLNFAQRNVSWKSTQFIARLAQFNGDQKWVTQLTLSTAGKSSPFEIPGKPGTPVIDHNAASTGLFFRWEPSSSSQNGLIGYECFYALRMNGDHAVREWKQLAIEKSPCAHVVDIDVGVSYEVKVRGVTTAGVTEDSDIMTTPGAFADSEDYLCKPYEQRLDSDSKKKSWKWYCIKSELLFFVTSIYH